MKRKEFNGTPHFYSLPQGERRIKRVPPHPTLSRGVERKKMKRFKQYPYPDPLPRSGEGIRKMKRFKQYPSPLPSPVEWRGDL
jgi:hypothetical protein